MREHGQTKEKPGRKPDSHRDLIVWQKTMDLAVEIYRLSRRFPREETYGLVSQLTRAVVSVPANIAEGRARGTRKDFANFLAIAKGSLMETETLLTLAVRLDYLRGDQTQAAFSLITEASKMLTSLRARLLESTKPSRNASLVTSNLSPITCNL